MSTKYIQSKYETIRSTTAYQGPSFLPVDLDTSGFIDITSIGDRFRVYLDPKTGVIHDGNVYYVKAKELRNDN